MTLTTDEAALIAEIIYDEIIEYKEAVAVGRDMYVIVNKNDGDSVKVVTEGAWPAAVEVAEGAEVPIMQPTWTPRVKTYKKYAYRTQITHEMVTDARWDMVQRQARKAGQQLGLKESLAIIEDAKSDAGNTFTVSGRWGGATADEVGDLLNCMGKIQGANYDPDILVVHAADWAHIAGLDEFVHREKGGVGLANFYKGDILGMRVLVTTQMSENDFLMLDKDQAGTLFLREDLRTEDYVKEERDLQGQVFFLREIPAVLAPSAICYASGFS